MIGLGQSLQPRFHYSPFIGKWRASKRGVDILSKREKQVLSEMARGKSAHDIAKELGISIKTVYSHRLRGMENLGIRDDAKLAHFFLFYGIIPNLYESHGRVGKGQ